jgi:hypothetical protein
MTKVWSALAGAGALAAMSGAAHAQTPSLQVEHAAARLMVVAEPRADVAVTVQHGPSRLPPFTLRREGGRVIVDGGLARRSGGDSLRCVGGQTVAHPFALFGHDVAHLRDTRAVVVPGVGRVEFGDLPVITAHVPLDAHLASEGAVWGEVGGTRALTLATVGCGDWTAGTVSGPLTVEAVGSGDVRAADAGVVRAKLSGSGDLSVGRVAGAAELSLAGSGDLRSGPVGGPLSADLAGSGDVDVASVSGPVRSRVASSGDVRIHGGRTPDLQVSLAGSGDFDFRGSAGRVTASVAGSGDVRIAHADGPVSRSVVGSGEVQVGR